MDWLPAATFWHWWCLGAALALLDAGLPRRGLLGAALAAALVGFLLLLHPALAWYWQALLFAMPAAAGVGLQCWRRRGTYRKPWC